MIDTYANVEYDEKTRRINRRMKVLGGIIAGALAILAIAVIVAAVDSLSGGTRVVNDTAGDVICYGRYTSSRDSESVRVSGTLKAGESHDIAVNSRCAVFSAQGDYVGCFGVRDNEKQILASSNNSRVKAETCVYPR